MIHSSKTLRSLHLKTLFTALLLAGLLACGPHDHDHASGGHDHDEDVAHGHPHGDDDHDDDHGHPHGDDDHDDDHRHPHGDDDHDDDHGHPHGDDDHDDDHGHAHGDDDHDDDHGHAHDDDGWSFTAWGEHFEIFAEADPLIAGETVGLHTHVTRLQDFSPLTEGVVEIALSGPTGETVSHADVPVRPGIYDIDLSPPSPGTFFLHVRLKTTDVSEEILSGRVRVGTDHEPGGLVEDAQHGHDEAVSFGKEEQWRVPFATAEARVESFARGVAGHARIRPPAGGEAMLTATVGGLVGADSWPFPGLRVRKDEKLLRLVPNLAADRSLADLEAETAVLETQLSTAQARLERLQELAELDAVGRRDLDEAAAEARALALRRDAAVRDLEQARSARAGGDAAGGDAAGVALRAPFTGDVAEVLVTPGATVAAGDELVRLTRSDLRWIEVALPPAAVHDLSDPEDLVALVLGDAEEARRITDGLRLVAVAPELSPHTGMISALLEIPAEPEWLIGRALDAQILFRADREGVVVPASAVLDDGGIPVVYVQVSGEEFVRRPVSVKERQGDKSLVEGLTPGERIVARGGDIVRRASLMSAGVGHGHVH